MDNIMPSYSFSHQFYQHWTDTPSSIRAAIVDELSDIIDLLHPETALAEFRFTQPDLDAHIDSLYDEHYTQVAQAQAEQARLEKEEQTRLEAQQAQVAAPVASPAATVDPIADEDTSEAMPVVDTDEQSVTDTQQAATDAGDAAAINSAFGEALIQELGTHIDDYLSEQMAQISEDLKSWLRDEIGRQLSNMTPKDAADGQ
ncbi:hypothetical protein [Psychrobacter aestuarii]|uniref:DUF2497 domain-containing protein n=1 Tax=Psychrobacter aestuarii TaxID=556327 RepID=A0ABP3FRF4_9GAMM|nr:hypothetical protein [Psychrobacter aestuarii]